MELFQGVHKDRLLIYDITKPNGNTITNLLHQIKIWEDDQFPHAHQKLRKTAK